MVNTNIRDLLANIDSSSCPHLINLHTHTTCSDGSLSPVELVIQAAKLGVSHLSITDHHSLDAYTLIENWILDSNPKSFRLPIIWKGIEISSLLKGCLVHLIGLDIDINSEHLYPYILGESVVGPNLIAESVINSIHNAGGIAILAHPARYRLGFKELIEEAYNIGIDGVEVWYDYKANRGLSWQPTPFLCEQILKLANTYSLLSTCGTDTHGYSLLSR